LALKIETVKPSSTLITALKASSIFGSRSPYSPWRCWSATTCWSRVPCSGALAYGGGVIIRDTERQGLGRRQVFLMNVFLSMVHAIFEDSLVLIAVGASAIWVVSSRTVWAVAVTAVVGAAATAFARRRRPS